MTTTERISKRRKIGAFVVFGLIALALGIGIAVSHSRAEKRRALAEIQKHLDAIRAAGEPVTADDLAKLFPDPPPERDAELLLGAAAPTFGQLNSSIKLPFFDEGQLPGRTRAFTDQMRTNIQALLKDNQTALNAIPWDKITNAWFGSSFKLGFTNMDDPRMYRVDMLVRLLCLKAVFDSESGEGTESCESLRRALTVSHTLRSDTMLHLLTRRAGENRVYEALERVLNRSQISADELAALETLLLDDHPGGLREAFMSVRCLNIFEMTTIPNLPNSFWYSPHSSESKLETAFKSLFYGTAFRLSGRIYADADFSEMLDVRAAQIAALKLPPKERFAEFTRFNIRAASQIQSMTYASRFAGAALGLSKQVRSDAEVLAKLQVTRAALEIERWRLTHGGRAPDSLSDLVPEFASSIPLDPFDNKPLRYKKLTQGFVIYSIGADFTDDGGKEKEPGDNAGSDHYDITFTVERNP
jgi:hypothetical protein